MATTLRDIGFRLGYDIDKASEAKAEDSIKSLKNMATKLLGAIGIGFSLVQVNAIIEEFTTINRSIKSAVGGLGDVEEAERLVLQAANESRTTYGAMADIVSDLAKSNSDLFPIQDAVDFSSTVTKLLKTSGRSDQEIQSMMDGLNKSFQKGIVDTETLNVMLEQCPEAANLLSKRLGIAKTQLLDMASNGQISCQQLKDAFLDSADEIDAAFDEMNLSITDAITNVRNSWGYLLADFDETFGVTDKIARTIVRVSNAAISVMEKVKTRLQWLAEKLGGTDNLLKLIAISAGAIFIAMKGDKILSFLKSAGKMLNKGNLKIMAIVAVIILLALLVEDFFAFMKGENSLIGEMLEKAGVDTDEFRDTVKGLWEQVKKVLQVVKQFAKAIGGQLLDAVKKILPLLGKLVAAILPVVLDLITAILPILEPIIELVMNLVQMLLPPLVTLLEAILPILQPILDILGPIADILGTIIKAIAKVVGWVADGLGWIVDLFFGGGGDSDTAKKVNAYAKGTDSTSDTFIAGEEGPELVTGQAGKKVFTALETGKIFAAMAMLGRAAVAKPSTVTNSSSSRVVNQYNNFANTFNGDRAGQSKSAEAMGTASNDAVAEMARALAFTR